MIQQDWTGTDWGTKATGKEITGNHLDVKCNDIQLRNVEFKVSGCRKTEGIENVGLKENEGSKVDRQVDVCRSIKSRRWNTETILIVIRRGKAQFFEPSYDKCLLKQCWKENYQNGIKNPKNEEKSSGIMY